MKKILFMVIILVIIIAIAYSQCAHNSQSVATSKSTQASAEIPKIAGLNTARLTTPQIQQLAKILDEEMCPCGKPVSFNQCLSIAAQCSPAIFLGQWIADRMADGVPANLLAEATTKEIGGGFASKPENIVLDGYARQGAANPKIRIVEFADFTCVHCRAATKSLHSFAQKYPNEIEIMFKHMPLANHPMALSAAEAAEAAGLQGKFWEMHDALFDNQNKLNKDLILGLAKAIGLNFAQFQKDLESKQVKDKVIKSTEEARRLGLAGTPTFFFNSRQYNLSFDLNGFELRRRMELARPQSELNALKKGSHSEKQASAPNANAVAQAQ